MPFEKGKSGNPKGRPKGAKNKKIHEVLGIIDEALEAGATTLIADMKELSAKDRLNFWAKLLEFRVAKLKRSEIKIDLSNMTADQVEEALKIALDLAE